MDASLFIIKFLSLLTQCYLSYWFLDGTMAAGEVAVYLFFLTAMTFFALFVMVITIKPEKIINPEIQRPNIIAFNADRFWNEIFLFILPLSLATAVATQSKGNDQLMAYPFGLITLTLIYFSFKKKFK